MNKVRRAKVSSSKVNYDFYQEQWKGAGAYLDRSAGAKWYNHLIAEHLKLVDTKNIKRVLDVGCGVGNKTHFLAKNLPKAKVLGSDFSETGIEEARKHYKARNLSFEVGNVTKTKSQGKADLVTIFEVLEHVDDWKAVLGKDILKSVEPRYVLIGSPTGKRYEGGIHMGHVMH